MATVPDIRLSTLTRLASTTSLTVLAYYSDGKPVGLDPSAFFPLPADIGAAVKTDVDAALALKQSTSAKGIANGYAGLDATGKIPASQIPAGGGSGPTLSDVAPSALGGLAVAGASGTASRSDHVHLLPTASQIGAAPTVHTHSTAAITGLDTALGSKMDVAQKGVINGVASLDSTGRVPAAQLPPGLSQADLDAKADAAATTSALNLKADAAATTSALAGKASSTDTRLVNAVQPDFKTTIENITTTYTAQQADANKIKRSLSATNFVVTLPSLSIGTTIRFLQDAAGRMTFAAGSGQTIKSYGGFVQTGGLNANVIVTVIDVNTWNISGNLI